MKTKIPSFAMTFFAFSTIFVSHLGIARASDSQTVTQIIFKGSEAKMGLNLFKFQLRNKLPYLNLNPNFVLSEKEIDFNIEGLKHKEIVTRLSRAINANNNCSIIKETIADQMNATVGYSECVRNARSKEAIMSLNKKQYSSYSERIRSEKKLTIARVELSLDISDVDSDTISILTSLASDVQMEINNLRTSNPSSSQISVVSKHSAVGLNFISDMGLQPN